MTGHGAKFGRKKDEAIAALLSERSIEEAARACSMSAKTLLHWLKMPEFRADYVEARGQVLSQSNARLQQATGAAVTTLLKVMVSPDAAAATRVRAAQSVVELAHKGFELDSLEVRLSRLEAAAGEDANQARGK